MGYFVGQHLSPCHSLPLDILRGYLIGSQQAGQRDKLIEACALDLESIILPHPRDNSKMQVLSPLAISGN